MPRHGILCRLGKEKVDETGWSTSSNANQSCGNESPGSWCSQSSDSLCVGGQQKPFLSYRSMPHAGSHSCTHTEGTKSGTKDGTKQWRFGVDVLGRSNGLNYLSNDTTRIDTVSLLLLYPERIHSASVVYSHCFSLAVQQCLVVIGKVLVDSFRRSALNRSKQFHTSGGSL